MLAHENISKTLVWVGGWAWFPSLSCCGVWDDPNRSKTACSSREPLRISLKIKYGKDFPFGLHVLSRAIMFYHMNWYKLSWVILNFAEWWVHSRKVLVIYRSFPIAYTLFASLKMSSLSTTYSEYWYPHSPDNSLHNKTQILHSEPILPERSIQAMIPSKNCKEYELSSLKKLDKEAMKERKRKSRQDPYPRSRELK